MPKKIAEKTVTIPSNLSRIPIEISGETYFLSFDMDALSDAEEFFNKNGANVNLLRSLGGIGLKNVRNVFPCALHTHHPKIGFKEAQKLLTIQASYEVAAAIVAIWSPAPSDQLAAPVEG